MTLQNIMKEIYSGLIGDYYRDKAYLLKNKETYSTHELYDQIQPKIDELLEELEDTKKKKFVVNETREEKIKRINKSFKKILKYIDEEDYKKAKKDIEYIFSRYKEFFDFKVYKNKFSFADTIEMCIYIYYYKPEINPQLTDLDNSEFYRVYGNVLFKLKEYSKAVYEYELSLKWDPVNPMTFINLAQVYNIIDKKLFVSTINKAIIFCTRKKDLSLCYKYLANYYLEAGEHELAICLYKFSNSLNNNKSVKELNEIENKIKLLDSNNKGIGFKSPKEVIEILNQNKIEIAPSKIVITTLKNLIKQAAQNNISNIEKYCTNVLENLLA